MPEASSYSFRPKGSGAADYIDVTARETGMDKAEIMRRAVLLAEQIDLFSDAREEHDAEKHGVEDGTRMDGVHVVDTKADDTSQPESGVHASDLAQVAPKPSSPSDDDAPQSSNTGEVGDARPKPSLMDKIWNGW